MKAIVENQSNLVKIIAEEITTANNLNFNVEHDPHDTIEKYGLTYKPEQSMRIEDIGDSYPSDWASDKYKFVDGTFILNGDYVVPSF